MSWAKLGQKCPLIWLILQKKALLICILSTVVGIQTPYLSAEKHIQSQKKKIESLVLTLRLSARFRLDKRGEIFQGSLSQSVKLMQDLL